ncbi:MAG: hypothetical protein J5879_01730 [Clostridia bacterium]|nr:hypothetical protein [Clostridia bacterium]
MRKIYVVLTCGGDPSKALFRKLTDSDYDHVSVSFNEKLPVMYSFARSQLDVPLVGGFVAEYPSRFLACGRAVPVRIYALEVGEEEYTRVRDVIRRIMTHPQIYTYNIYDKAATVVGGQCPIKRSYTDMTFVCKLLHLGKIRSMKELQFILSPHLVYDGTMNEIVEPADERHGADYFSRVPAPKAFAKSFVYSAKLLGRKVYEDL